MGALLINAYGVYADEIHAELMLQAQQHGLKPLRFFLLSSAHALGEKYQGSPIALVGPASHKHRHSFSLFEQEEEPYKRDTLCK